MKSSAGFTLTETLAALAIMAMIILSTGTLIHQTVFFFDHGTRTIDRSEELALATDSLARDFAGARFVLEGKAGDPAGNDTKSKHVKAMFLGTPASDSSAANILFITAGGRGAAARGEEIVDLTVEQSDGLSELVRHRTSWAGPIMSMEDASLVDPVILLKGHYAISFSYAELTKDGDVIWHEQWTGEHGLPYAVRLNLRDDETNADLLPGAEFRIRADGSPICVTDDAKCLLINDNITAAENAANPASVPGEAIR